MTKRRGLVTGCLWAVCAIGWLFGGFVAKAEARGPVGKPWGAYTIVVKTGDDSTGTERVITIRAANGHIVKTITGYNNVAIAFENITNSPVPDVLIAAGDGGNLGLDITYGFAQLPSGKVVNLLIGAGDPVDFVVKDLAGDGKRELVYTDCDFLMELDHFSRGGVGEITRTYAWNGEKLIDVAAQYPQATDACALAYRKRFLDTQSQADTYLHSKFVNGNDDTMDSSHEDVMAPAICYWSNEMEAGKADAARIWFKANASPAIVSYLIKIEPMLRKSVFPHSGALLSSQDNDLQY